MNVRLAYGKSGLDVTLPDGLAVDVVRPNHVEALADQAEAVRDALLHPISSRPLRELVNPSDTIGIVCNDITRPTPYGIILPVLLQELRPVSDEAITFLIANGTHRFGTPEELRTVLGEEIVDRFRVVQNDAHDREAHARVGTTADGNEVWIHKEYLRCDVRILTGFIEPHFFVGFSGAGKACMPGLAALETILRNHCARNMDHPGATWAVTHGNPIWEEIREAALLAAPTFLLNVTLNRDKQITGVFAGDMDRAHEHGCEFVKQRALAPVPVPYDIVITSNAGSPLDLNLYQAVKGMSAAAQIVKKGGAIILAADCWDGIPEHGRYQRLLFEATSPRSLLERVRADDCHCQDAWQAQIHAQVCAKADVYLFSHNLTDEQIERALLKPCRDVAGTVEQLLRVYGRDASICVLPEGPQTIPYIATGRQE
ncbi:MAG: nickel-dependent lactate racemase [Planctomycetes bacterium]|nr:nickel-dependent lactate racemase [Planctomycetota bacterium]